jgi:hypothetical protein
MLALEDFEHDGPHHRGEGVAERALREHHQIDQRQARQIFQRDQRGKTDREAEAGDRPGGTASPH